VTALAGELTVRQLGEMLRERGMRLDGLWWSRRLGGWAVDVSGIDALRTRRAPLCAGVATMKKKPKTVLPEDERPKRSPARQLVDLVWREAPTRSWRYLNRIMADALTLAIRSNMRFDPGDLTDIYASCSGGFWFGANSEWIHRIAVIAGNTSAAVEYERFADRGPFFYIGRLYVGRVVPLEFIDMEHPMQGAVCAIVTSLSGDDVIICVYNEHARDVSYRIEKGGVDEGSGELSWGDGATWPGGKPIRRVRLTLAQVRAKEKARKEAIEAKAAAKEKARQEADARDVDALMLAVSRADEVRGG